MSGGLRFPNVDCLPEKWRTQARRQLGHVEKRDAPKRSKYGAKRITVDGILFDSKREAERYLELKGEEKRGFIRDVKTQVSFNCIVNGELICRYIADFQYTTPHRVVVEDVKGYKKGAAYGIFRIKKKLMKACNRIDVEEVS